MKSNKLFNTLSLFSVLALFVTSTNLWAGTTPKKASSKCSTLIAKPASIDIKPWLKIAPVRIVAEQFGYNSNVLKRIAKIRPDLYVEMAKIHTGQESQYSREDLMPADLARGMVLNPKDYDPLFVDNNFGGNTKKGASWFSRDSAMASDYAKPDADQLKELKQKKPHYVGIKIFVQIPEVLVDEATVSSFRAGSNISLDRDVVGNESAYISDVSLTAIDHKNNELSEEVISYAQFVKRFPSKSLIEP